MFVIREGRLDDRGFVLSTWLKGYRYGSSFGRRIRNGIFFRNHHALAEEALSRSVVLVATLEDDPNVIVGYVVVEPGEPSTIHWLHVKEPFRRNCVAVTLLGATGLPPDLKGVEYSHASDDAFGFLQRRFPEATYNPYRFFRPSDSAGLLQHQQRRSPDQLHPPGQPRR
jgi:hypothetical protein